jgi:hypothetical protein
MSHDTDRIDRRIPGLQALLETLGVSIVDHTVKVPFNLGPDPPNVELAAIGWATVELDRAETDLSAEFATTFEPTIRDALLGASVRRSTADRPRILILEPDTEGRLAGALAKHGEGPVALYLRVAKLEALPRTLSIRRGNGPFGPARLVIGAAALGPFIILVEQRAPADADRVPSGA